MSILTNIHYTDVIKGDVCVCRYVELPHYYLVRVPQMTFIALNIELSPDSLVYKVCIMPPLIIIFTCSL